MLTIIHLRCEFVVQKCKRKIFLNYDKIHLDKNNLCIFVGLNTIYFEFSHEMSNNMN